MIRFARHFIAVFLASLAIAMPARATTYSIDLTDIWWAGPTEDGWGVTVSQQGEVIFATFFIYGADRSARWFSAALFPVASPAGLTVFSGDMFRSTGSFYGAANFTKDPATKVGTVTMSFNSASTATLTYTIDGVSVTKQILRQTFRNTNLTGDYTGGLVSNRTSCTNAALNGFADVQGQLTVTHTDPSIVLQVGFTATDGSAGSCVFRGVYVPSGRLGTISSGTWSCVAGNATVVQGVSFSMTNIDAQLNGFHGNFVATDQGQCLYNGRFGAVRNP